MEAATKRGYVPTTQARRLAMGLTETIGLVLPPMPSQPVNTFVSEFINSVSAALHLHGYDLLVHSANSEESEVELYLGFFGICGVDQKVVTVKMKCRGNGIDEFTDKSIDRLGWHRRKDQPDGFRQPHRQSACLGGRDITALCGRFHHPLSGLLGNVLVTVESP